MTLGNSSEWRYKVATTSAGSLWFYTSLCSIKREWSLPRIRSGLSSVWPCLETNQYWMFFHNNGPHVLLCFGYSKGIHLWMPWPRETRSDRGRVGRFVRTGQSPSARTLAQDFQTMVSVLYTRTTRIKKTGLIAATWKCQRKSCIIEASPKVGRGVSRTESVLHRNTISDLWLKKNTGHVRVD